MCCSQKECSCCGKVGSIVKSKHYNDTICDACYEEYLDDKVDELEALLTEVRKGLVEIVGAHQILYMLSPRQMGKTRLHNALESIKPSITAIDKALGKEQA